MLNFLPSNSFQVDFVQNEYIKNVLRSHVTKQTFSASQMYYGTYATTQKDHSLHVGSAKHPLHQFNSITDLLPTPASTAQRVICTQTCGIAKFESVGLHKLRPNCQMRQLTE